MGISALVLAAVLASANMPPTEGPFEGEVVMNNRIQGMEVEIRFLIRGPRMRVEMAGMKDPITLVDVEKREALSLDVKRRAYVATALAAPRTLQDARGIAERTGNGVVAGHTCEEWVARSGPEVYRIWALGGVVYSPHPWLGTPTGDLAVFDFLRSRNLFPLKLVQEDKAGQTRIAWEAVRMERKTLDPSLFELPKGYQRAK